jgi:EthD domain
MAERCTKMIYLARANPELPEGGFAERWRQHGALSRTLPIWRHHRKYEQCLTLESGELPAEAIPGFQADWDGVGLIWFWGSESLARAATEPTTASILGPDELETFDRSVGLTAMITSTEDVLRDRGATNVKLVVFVKSGPNVTADEFERRWRDLYASLVEGPESDLVRKCIQSRVVPSQSPFEAEPPISEFEGVLEIGFETVADLGRFLASDGYRRVRAEEEDIVDPEATIGVVTDETLLYTDLLGSEDLSADAANRSAISVRVGPW